MRQLLVPGTALRTPKSSSKLVHAALLPCTEYSAFRCSHQGGAPSTLLFLADLAGASSGRSFLRCWTLLLSMHAVLECQYGGKGRPSARCWGELQKLPDTLEGWSAVLAITGGKGWHGGHRRGDEARMSSESHKSRKGDGGRCMVQGACALHACEALVG